MTVVWTTQRIAKHLHTDLSKAILKTTERTIQASLFASSHSPTK